MGRLFNCFIVNFNFVSIWLLFIYLFGGRNFVKIFMCRILKMDENIIYFVMKMNERGNLGEIKYILWRMSKVKVIIFL